MGIETLVLAEQLVLLTAASSPALASCFKPSVFMELEPCTLCWVPDCIALCAACTNHASSVFFQALSWTAYLWL